MAFHAWHWQRSGIRLLTDEGVEQVPLEELEEIRFPADDSLDSYFGSLAVLLPQVRGRVLVCQTLDGLRATTSTERRAFASLGPRPGQNLVHATAGLEPGCTVLRRGAGYRLGGAGAGGAAAIVACAGAQPASSGPIQSLATLAVEYQRARRASDFRRPIIRLGFRRARLSRVGVRFARHGVGLSHGCRA